MSTPRDTDGAARTREVRVHVDTDRGVFMISVAAELASMHPQTLRMYEARGLIAPKRSPKGTRLYSQEDVEKLKLLKGHVRKGQFVTKLRKVFHKDEMSDDLEFVRARVGDRDDDIEYFSILPTSPP